MCVEVVRRGLELGFSSLEATAKLYQQMYFLVYERDFCLQDLAELLKVQE
jgi:hypothetical protein